ncbi:hypothetical protein ACH5RR_005919 [Cinchona calisaya]|uniref:Uncharacterized protein n=1 Tax=Cinchona calisaya TaxID=153742 RepID=A0ABD3AMV2_9GENT
MVWFGLIPSSLHGSETGFGLKLKLSAIARFAKEVAENLNLKLNGGSSFRLVSFLLQYLASFGYFNREKERAGDVGLCPDVGGRSRDRGKLQGQIRLSKTLTC